MAHLRIRSRDDPENDFNYPNLDDAKLAKMLAMIDESIITRGGTWLLHTQGDDPTNHMFWVSAAQLDVRARFDGEAPTKARAIASLSRGW